MQHLMWLPRTVLAAVSPPASSKQGGGAELLLYPRYHLDNASILGRLSLSQVLACMYV